MPRFCSEVRPDRRSAVAADPLASVRVTSVRYNGEIHDFIMLNALADMPATRAGARTPSCRISRAAISRYWRRRIGLEWHGGHLRGLWMGVAPSHLGLLSQICARRSFGEEQPTPAAREVPFTEGRMVLSATRPQDRQPADPCNKVTAQNYSVWTGSVKV
jgi:hypothetical protein